MTEHQEFSPQVRHVLSRIPKWYERWGTVLVSVFFLILMVMSWFIRYPDTISATVVITTQLPPLTLHSRTPGILTRLKPDGSKVIVGEELALIANPATIEDVYAAQAQLDAVSIRLRHPSALASMVAVEYRHLGSIQTDFSTFVQRLSSYQYLLQTNHFQRKAENIQRRTKVIDGLNEKLAERRRVLEQELQVYYQRYKRDSALLAGRALSSSDVERTQIEYLQKKGELQSLMINVDQNDLLKGELGEAFILGHQAQSEALEAALVSLQESMQKLQSSIDTWKQAYLITAPVTGTLAYLSRWSEGQFVVANDAVFSVVPSGKQLLAQGQLPQQGSGKVQSGQRVLIKLENYPSYQYGSLEGTVSAISLVPNAGKYLVTIGLPWGLTTSFRRDIAFRQQMKGTAQIITADLSLFERIFFQFKSLFFERTQAL